MSRAPSFDQVTNEVGLDPEEREILRHVWVKRIVSKDAAKHGDQHAHHKSEAEIERHLAKLGVKGRKTFLLCIITRPNDVLDPHHPDEDDEEITKPNPNELDS
jgi:hypothetical protein